MQILNSWSDFITYMVEEGVSVSSKLTYLKYERLGIFVPGKHSFTSKNGRVHRAFTNQELAENLERYRKVKNRKKKK